jgi:quercetin dioxygenase-like cupin family protein
MNASNPMAGTSVRFQEGRVVMVLGMPHIVKVAAGENVAGTSVMEVIVAPGQGVPPHTHTHEDEFFLILQGEITCQMHGSASPVTLTQGDHLFLPRNRMHSFINASAKEARMMVTVTPGAGTDRMFADLEKACQRFTDPQQLMPEVGRICGSYGITFAPPS